MLIDMPNEQIPKDNVSSYVRKSLDDSLYSMLMGMIDGKEAVSTIMEAVVNEVPVSKLQYVVANAVQRCVYYTTVRNNMERIEDDGIMSQAELSKMFAERIIARQEPVQYMLDNLGLSEDVLDKMIAVNMEAMNEEDGEE